MLNYFCLSTHKRMEEELLHDNRDTINSLMAVFGYGYAHVFSDVTESVRQMHISKEQLSILEYLHINGSATPTELSEKLKVQKSSIAHALRKLTTKKLVRSSQNIESKDRRSKLISLTDSANQVIEEILKHLHTTIGHKIENLSVEEQKKLTEASQIIIKTFNMDGGLFNETGA